MASSPMSKSTSTDPWRDYRGRRRWFLAAWLGGPLLIAALVQPLAKATGSESVALAILIAGWLGAFLLTYRRRRSFLCPNCAHRFESRFLPSFSETCSYCHEPARPVRHDVT